MLWNYAWRGTNAGVPTAAVFGSGRSLTSTNAFSASTTFPTNVLATLWAFGVFHMIAVFGAGFLCYVLFVLFCQLYLCTLKVAANDGICS
jgi:hypothetical protein